jgi:hypothetical protein
MYCFKGGEKKISTMQEIFPIGSGGLKGYITSQCIQGSPAPLLLSLEVQRALGMVLNVPKGTADFTELGLYDIKLVRTREGRLGIRITEFGKEEARHKEKEEKRSLRLPS